MKSPIKDLRFENKSINQLKKMIPKGSKVATRGLFSGAPEISLSLADRRVDAFTNKTVIYQFWYCLFENRGRIYNILTDSSFNFRGSHDYELLQKSLPQYQDAYLRSSLFFLLNRTSKTGQVSCGEFEPSGYSNTALRYLRMFKKPEAFNIFLYSGAPVYPADCDYLLFHSLTFSHNLTDIGFIKSYDNYNFNNRKLRKLLDSEDGSKIILVYNKHPALFKFYEDYRLLMVDKYGKETTSRQECGEVIVANF